MRPAVRHAIVFLAIAIVGAPIAVVITLLLLPFWRWLEETSRIESVGHSGPADWCFMAVYAVCVLAAGVWYAAWTSRLSARSRDRSAKRGGQDATPPPAQ